MPTLGSDRPFNPLILHAVSHSFEQMLACAQLIAFGVLERHPGLRVVFLESSRRLGPLLARTPRRTGRVLRRLLPGPGACAPRSTSPASAPSASKSTSARCPALVPFVGDDRIVWGSDYPHHDATFPGAIDALRATIAPCPTATQAKVLGLNARHLYHLPPRRPAPTGIIDDYFAAVTAHDADMLRGLFAPDAAFDVDGDRRRGRDAILAYYAGHTFGYADFRPDPGPLRIDGPSVTVDIDVYLGGSISRVRDVFETDGERITSLRVQGFADALRAAGPGPG